MPRDEYDSLKAVLVCLRLNEIVIGSDGDRQSPEEERMRDLETIEQLAKLVEQAVSH
jgi:hypothetical protein